MARQSISLTKPNDEWLKKVTVIVNDMSEVNIDAQLVERRAGLRRA